MTSKKTDHKRVKTTFFLFIGVLCALLLATAGLLAVLLGYAPHGYAPPAPEDPERVSLYLTHQLGPDFFNHVQLDEPFELEIEQTGLNEIISYGFWPQPHGHVLLWQPMILFEPDKIVVHSQVSFEGLSSVVTLVARPELDDSGHLLMNIQSVRMGALPVTALATHIARASMRQHAAELADWPQLEPIIRAIIEAESFMPEYEIEGRKVSMEQFRLEPGRAVLRLTAETVKDDRQVLKN